MFLWCFFVDDYETQQGNRQVLENDLHETQRQSFGKGTVQNLLSQWRAFYAFCNIYVIYVWLVTAHVLCLFAQFLSYNFKSPNSIVNYLNGVRTLHLLTNFPVPDMKDFEVRITVKGLRHCLKHRVKQAFPITPLIFGQIHGLLNLRKKFDVVFWSSLLLGFFLMVRASNLVPRVGKRWSRLRQLNKSSVTFNKKGMIIKIRWSKTIQFRQCILEIPVYAIPNSILCPVKAVKRLLQVNKLKPHGPLLALSDDLVFTYGMLQKKLKQVISDLGLNKNM